MTAMPDPLAALRAEVEAVRTLHTLGHWCWRGIQPVPAVRTSETQTQSYQWGDAMTPCDSARLAAIAARLLAVAEAATRVRELDRHARECCLDTCEYDGLDFGALVDEADATLDAALAALEVPNART